MNGVGAGPFHEGELRAQALAGVRSSGTAIRSFMTEQHRDFYAGLEYVMLATTEPDGWPVATMLTGPAGFIEAPDATVLELAVHMNQNDPATRAMRQDGQVGLLGIDMSNRRRNRANGVISLIKPEGFSLEVRESFGNCPKYIHLRDAVPAAAATDAPVEHFSGLDEAARRTLSTAETMFVASSSGAHGGVDLSHRGGPAGFAHVEGVTLTIPDYSGNRYFNTLGNFLLEPRSALLLIDFDSGDLLHLQGRAEVLWQPPDQQKLPAAERSWKFLVQRGWRRRAALPLRWRRQGV